jgi:hypothetical protein
VKLRTTRPRNARLDTQDFYGQGSDQEIEMHQIPPKKTEPVSAIFGATTLSGGATWLYLMQGRLSEWVQSIPAGAFYCS